MARIDSRPQIVRMQDVAIPKKQIVRRLGYPSEGEINGDAYQIFVQELDRAPSLLDPVGVYCLLNVASKNEKRMTFLDSDFVIQSKQVVKLLRDSNPVVLFMVTIGPGLEDEVNRLFQKNDMARGFILDAIGSETADAAADRMHHQVLKRLSEERRFSITPRFSPGYGDWPVTVQKDFLKTCGGASIGISVNDSFLMTPRKSVSAVLGWVKRC